MQIQRYSERRRALRGPTAFLAGSLMAVLAGGCGPAEQPADTQPVLDVHNPSLAVTIAGLPAEWSVRTNVDQRLELTPSDINRSGLVSVSVGPEERGVNLVAAVEAHKVEIGSRHDAVYSGAQELSGPLGAAFYSRGRYSDGEALTEETRIFALHPTASRLLVVTYTYPAGDDSSSRVSELIELFALVE